MPNSRNTAATNQKFKNFLKDLFEEVAKGDQSAYEYFAPDAKNKENFLSKTNPILQKHFDGIADVFDPKDARKGKAQIFTNAIFKRVTKEMHDGSFYLYLPRKSGEDFAYSTQQEKIFNHFATTILGTMAMQEELIPTQEDIAETVEKTTKNLKASGFKNTESLKYNETTELIEGTVTNQNNEEVSITVDASMPEFLFMGANMTILQNDPKELTAVSAIPTNLESPLVQQKAPSEAATQVGAQGEAISDTESDTESASAEQDENLSPSSSIQFSGIPTSTTPQGESGEKPKISFKRPQGGTGQSDQLDDETGEESKMKGINQIKLPTKGSLQTGMQPQQESSQQEQPQGRMSETQSGKLKQNLPTSKRITESELNRQKTQPQTETPEPTQATQQRNPRRTEEQEEQQPQQKKKKSLLKKLALPLVVGGVPTFTIGGMGLWQVLQG